MNLADRIQYLRKLQGISQEELADKIGVSRQSVSKWENEQSIPDMDKIILISDFFAVTTDYILKGIEQERSDTGEMIPPQIAMMIATVIAFIGLLVSCAIWYEKQEVYALAIGLALMAIACMIFGMGMIGNPSKEKEIAKRNFLMINIWIFSFIPLSFCYNLFISKWNWIAPYPHFGPPFTAYVMFWVVYLILCLFVSLSQYKKKY